MNPQVALTMSGQVTNAIAQLRDANTLLSHVTNDNQLEMALFWHTITENGKIPNLMDLVRMATELQEKLNNYVVNQLDGWKSIKPYNYTFRCGIDDSTQESVIKLLSPFLNSISFFEAFKRAMTLYQVHKDEFIDEEVVIDSDLYKYIASQITDDMLLGIDLNLFIDVYNSIFSSFNDFLTGNNVDEIHNADSAQIIFDIGVVDEVREIFAIYIGFLLLLHIVD